MSEQPQGPGWWQASDGRYYPPQQQPYGTPEQPPQYGAQPPQYGAQPPQYGAQPPQYGAQPPQYGAQPPQYAQPQSFAPPQPRGGGCGKVALVVLAVLVVLTVGVVAAGYYAFNWIGHKASDVVGGGPCEVTTDAVAGKGLGIPITLQSGSGLGGIVSGIIDSRVLADAPSCWGTATVTGSGTGSDAGGLLVRVAQQSGGAAARFQTEVKQAKGVVVSSSSDGQGGTTSVETAAYYGTAVKGIGDEAFCTTMGGTGAVGILVRKGDRLVYASVGGTTDGSATGLLDEKAGCARAQKLAAAILAG